MVTDPPYGVDYDPLWREEAGLGEQRQTGAVQNDDRADWTAAYQLFPGNVAYVWHAGVHAAEVAAGISAAGFTLRSQIIWAKQHFAMSRGHYHWQHEPCWYAVREGRSAHWCGDRKQSTLWQLPNLNPFGGNGEEPVTGHGTQKPVELMRRPILNHTQLNDAVYDPFLGSGTTVVAAEITSRRCLGLEIDPAYVDVIILRWQALTGKGRHSRKPGRNIRWCEAAAADGCRKRGVVMARPRFQITAENRNAVRALAGYGLKHEQIARVIGMRSTKTLRKYFRSELASGAAEASAKVSQTLFLMATSGLHPGATMFWLKTQAHWRENAVQEQRPLVAPTLIISQEADDDSSQN